ncbi:MAG: hypothetical protein JXA81_11730, partial [Sedimentisphaerales bacterium]|nr:hypothetical protein [Sedimentisphaerales bacterium]
VSQLLWRIIIEDLKCISGIKLWGFYKTGGSEMFCQNVGVGGQIVRPVFSETLIVISLLR